jgi:predicted peroxiredoxin
VNLKPTNYKIKENEINVFMNVTNSGLSSCEQGVEFTVNESSFTGKLKKEQSNKNVKIVGDKKFSLK